MNKIQKSTSLGLKKADAAADIGLINQFSQRELTPEEVYCFSVNLCDNEVDRDGEYFTDSALKGLAKLFVGKTGVTDHEWKAGNQICRLYRVELVAPGGSNSRGTAKKVLRGSAYMIRTKETESIIKNIEGGILKEVSVGCAISRKICSICSGKMDSLGNCENGHQKGEYYDGKLCAVGLDGPTDAYEFSFVAVPAQRAAGVTKGKAIGEDSIERRMQLIQENTEFSRKEKEEKMETERKAFGEQIAEVIKKGGSIPLPRHMEKKILIEPEQKSGLRLLETVSHVKGLELPALSVSSFQVQMNDKDWNDFAVDSETRKELELAGDNVRFGSHKMRVFTQVSDTVFFNSGGDIMEAMERMLYSMQTKAEAENAFKQTATDTETIKMDHMSFYLNGIKEVSDSNLIEAAIKAWQDLPDLFVNNAACIMSKKAYYTAVKELAGSNPAIRAADPASVIGIPVVFDEAAVYPVVGDFNYSRLNYDIDSVLMVDRVAPKSSFKGFFLTTWYDHRILLKNAFRIAKVASAPSDKT